MIDSFFNDAAESLDSLQKSVVENNLNQFRFAAHAMKSCSNNIGAIALAALCGKLEKITEFDFTNKALLHEANVLKAFENVKADLQLYVSGPITQPVASSG